MTLMNSNTRSVQPFLPVATSSNGRTLRCRARSGQDETFPTTQSGARTKVAAALAAAALSMSAHSAQAAFRLPPLDRDPNRCERAYTGNTIGQANAVSDKVLDLRQCQFSGKNFSSKVLSGALVSDADFSNTNLNETVLTKAYAVGANFAGADMTSAVIDRVDFTKANLTGAKFANAVITGSIFKEADLSNTVFEGALVGGEDVKRICLNPTLQGESRVEIGCRTKK